MKGFAVTVAVAEPDTDGNGMVYDFAALKVSTTPTPLVVITYFIVVYPDTDGNGMVYDFAALKVSTTPTPLVVITYFIVVLP